MEKQLSLSNQTDPKMGQISAGETSENLHACQWKYVMFQSFYKYWQMIRSRAKSVIAVSEWLKFRYMSLKKSIIEHGYNDNS